MLVPASRQTCRKCAGTGKVGLLGPSGLGMVSRRCPSCAKTEKAEEWDALRELRERHCNIPYTRGPEGDSLLCEIWNAAFPDNRLDEFARSEGWKSLGFQSSDPHTDIRAGRFALDQLHYMAVMYPESLRQWVRQAEELEYFFAISCFNVSHLIVVFFDLVDIAAVSPVPGAKPASREQRKHFLRLCFGSPYSAATVLNELFVALVERLHRIWTEMREKEECNVMQHFQIALRGVYAANCAFWSRPHQGVEELRLMASLTDVS